MVLLAAVAYLAASFLTGGVHADSTANLVPEYEQCGFSLDTKWIAKYPWARPRPATALWFCQMIIGYSQEADTVRANGQSVPVVFYGASEMSCFRFEAPECVGASGVFYKYFGWYNASAWAVGYDSTHTLMWRLLAARHAPWGTGTKVSVVAVGGNDIAIWGSSESKTLWSAPPLIADRMLAIADLLAETDPRQMIVIMGLLPRGSVTHAPSNLIWPNWSSEYIWKVNWLVQKGVKERWNATGGASRIWFVDCGDAILNPNKQNLGTGLVLDGIHPTAAGWDAIMSTCLNSTITYALLAAGGL